MTFAESVFSNHLSQPFVKNICQIELPDVNGDDLLLQSFVNEGPLLTKVGS